MCRVIAIANQKGCCVPVAHVKHRPERERRRVGKTTTCVNLGIGLAREGKKVLLIEADAQGSMAASLGIEEPDELEITLANILEKVINDEELELREGMIHHVLYHANGYSTVFPINQCGKYLYGVQKGTCCMEECYFEKEAWYVRLILEGENRLVRNQDAREQSRNISYSDLSENWLFFGEKGFSVLEKLVITELMEEMFRPLTGKQKEVYLTYFGEKTQKQIAAELGISVAAVNQLLYMR